MEYLTFALAKGRLATQTLSILESIGITCEEMKDKSSRKLIFVNEEQKLKFFLAKASDVPTYVEYGAADIGVVGRDTILEEDKHIYEVLDLNIGKCRMCVAGPESAKEMLHNGQVIRVATKYPTIAKDYQTRFERADLLKNPYQTPSLHLSIPFLSVPTTQLLNVLRIERLEPPERYIPSKH